MKSDKYTVSLLKAGTKRRLKINALISKAGTKRRLKCFNKYSLVDFIRRKNNLFYDLSLVSHLPLTDYKRKSSK